ncbi:NAD-dependent epimerase/dehydratase family protein [Mycolicibacterium tokaiense]|uniref:Nucleoside-diphosphate-sugar epimerase n=1 Tax=Mycolicibacterium tokaiense TaxID=39695 RepID=A0A378TFU6_9MYCO|nr:NAD-dependent epimerase/dehydratase family protein [Mycolicibacterium tokaiense]BBY86475.1 putative UDP-glucose 4-epimerase GalE1 [Mycolicibacterium tokaiense]STZ59017.1 nucleoside-diphosphate-sugar epimerase [Mycolicibacterium tokaiense]
MTRAMVTGAAGFIGSALVDRLLLEGYDVIAIDNLSTGNMANLDHAIRANRTTPGRFAFHQLDVQAPELRGIVVGSNPDVIFHLAAHIDVRRSVADPMFDARTNVLGTVNICEAANLAGVRRIVYAASGGSRYGAPLRLPADEQSSLAPESPYAVSKIAGELYLQAYAHMYGITPICLALSNVYGPRQSVAGEAGVIAAFASALASGRNVTVFGDGSATRDYIYVDDVVRAFTASAEAPPEVTGTFNIGTGRQISVVDLHRVIALLFDGAPPPFFAPARTGEVQNSALDARKAFRELGWVPAVNLIDGIERTVAWLRSAQGADQPAELGA